MTNLFLELSRTYIQLTRNKSSGSDAEKKTVFNTIYYCLMENVKIFSTVAPFVCEKIYQNLKTEFGLEQESVHMLEWPDADEKLITSADNLFSASSNDNLVLVEFSKNRFAIVISLNEGTFLIG